MADANFPYQLVEVLRKQKIELERSPEYAVRLGAGAAEYDDLLAAPRFVFFSAPHARAERSPRLQLSIF